jgi:PAS domain S-box-containing protein
VCKAIPASLKTNPQDLPVTLVYLFENGETRARLACETGIERSHPAAPARIEIDAADAVWPIRDLLKTKGPVFVENLTELFGSMPTGAWDQPPTRAILVPITGQGQDRPAGVFITAVNPYRQLNAGYSGFIYLVAGQIAAGIANARAYEGERQRAEVLAALDRAKTTFFSNVSHEFRTPLTLMLGPTEDALANPEKALRGRELETVHRNELRLLKLVNTLLDFSRLEAGRVTASYQPTDLCAYTLELASIFRSAIEKAGLNYVVDCKTLPQPVYIDREMWEKIVLNLISNALKSTFHGSIELELVNKADHIEFEVRDTGTGIPEHELPHLFERFRRVEHARRRTHEGSGIGLALVHELLAMHGGKITVQSHVGKGTTFTISLPYGSRHLPRERVRPEAEQIVPGTARKAFVQEALSWLPGHPVDDTESREDLEAADALSAPLLITSSKPRVLLVDDNRDMREYVRRLLNSRFEVTTAENGRQALEKVNQQIPALVLSDVMMPEMDGLQLLAALRENPATSSVPVVLLSARAGEESLIEGMMSGADDYVVKPFTARELLARVEAHIKIASFRREALETEKRLQSELRASEREQLRLLAVMDQSTDFIGLADMEGRVLYVNKSARAMMGLGEKQDVRQLRIKDFFFPEDVPFLEDVVISTVLREGRWQGEVNFRHFKTGASISVDYHVFPVNDPQTGEMVGLATVTRDMRERKEAEAALRASESRYRVLAELSPQALWTTDKEGQVLYANRRFLDYAGKQSLPRDPQEYLNLFHEEDRERALAAWMHSVTTGEDFAIDVRLVRAADGAARWWHLRALPLRDEAGAIERWLGVADDVHEGRMAEQAVRIERARLVEMFRQAPAFMAMLRGPEHIFERTNRQYQELIGNRDVVGKPMRQALPEAEEQGFITLLDRVYETGEPFVATGRSLSVARVPGQPLEEHYLDFVYQPMRETDGTISGVLVLGVDVTERKRTEAALLQSEKLAAVGRLSASIAHEINNPLEAVTNLLYLLNEEKDLPEQARALLIWRNKSWRA